MGPASPGRQKLDVDASEGPGEPGWELKNWDLMQVCYPRDKFPPSLAETKAKWVRITQMQTIILSDKSSDPSATLFSQQPVRSAAQIILILSARTL